MTWFSNALSGALSSWSQMIDDVRSNCERPCRIYYPVTRYEDSASNSSANTTVGNKPGSVTSRGVPGAPWSHGSNPHIGPTPGTDSKRPVRTTSTINLCVFYNEKDWYKMSAPIANAEGMAQTLCARDQLMPLLQADYIVFDTDIEEEYQQRYERVSGPQICGFNSEYATVMWRKLGNG